MGIAWALTPVGDEGVGTGGWKDHPNLVLCSKEQGIKGERWKPD